MSMEEYKRKNEERSEKIQEMLDNLPDILAEYERYLRVVRNRAALTRLNYLSDLSQFFDYLASEQNLDSPSDLTFEAFDTMRVTDFTDYLGSLYQLDQKSLARKASAVRSFFKFLYTNHYITSTDYLAFSVQKKEQNNIVYLTTEQMQKVLDNVINGYSLTETQKKWHEKFYKRDTAIIALFLGTGIRVSECTNLDVDDLDLKENSITIVRKGGRSDIVFFSDAVKEHLRVYMKARKRIDTEETALFLNRLNSRMTPRSMERLVKKYCPASVVGADKTITPHKLRSSYATALYEKTSDIYLVADVLGHKDVNTTKAFYSKLTRERKKQAGSLDVLK